MAAMRSQVRVAGSFAPPLLIYRTAAAAKNTMASTARMKAAAMAEACSGRCQVVEPPALAPGRRARGKKPGSRMQKAQVLGRGDALPLEAAA